MAYAAMSVGNAAEEDAAGGLLPETVARLIETLAARGSERGYVTYDELSATLPRDQLSSEEIEDTLTMLSELGITVTESDDSEDPVAPEGEPAKADGNLVHDDTRRTDDPVRMYLREMRPIQRLSREREVATAKLIEAGREMMLGAIRESPLTFDAILGWRDALDQGTMLLRDIIDIDATNGVGFDRVVSGTPGEAMATPHGRRNRTRSPVPLHRSSAVLVCSRWQGPTSVSCAAPHVRSNHSGAEIGGPESKIGVRGRARRTQTA